MAAKSSGRLGNPLARPGLLRPGSVPAAAVAYAPYGAAVYGGETYGGRTAGTAAVVSGTTSYTKTITETTTASDSVTHPVAISRTVTETLTAASDSVSFVKGISVSRTVTETLTAASDSVSFTRTFNYPRTVTETTTASDSVSYSATHVLARTVSETLTAATDTVTRVYGQSRTVAESLTTPTDSVTFVKGRYIYETANGIDQVFVQVARPRTVTETLSTTDLITKLVATSRTVNETIPAASDIVKAPVVRGAASVTVLEYLNTFDNVTRSAGLLRSLTELVGPSSDIVIRGAASNRQVNESVPKATDAITRQASLSRLIRESIPIQGDSVLGYQPRPALPTQDVISYYAEAFSRPGPFVLNFKRTLGKILNRPVIKNTINAGQQQVTLEFASYADRSGVSVGDAVYLKERFTGQTVYGGYVTDAPEDFDVHSTYQLVIDPFITELGDNPFTTNAAGVDIKLIDVAEIVREACIQTRLNYIDGLTIPRILGTTMTVHFDASTTCLQAIEQCRLIAGPNYFFFVDHDGYLWFQQIHGMTGNTAHGYTFSQPADWIARLGTDISKRTVKKSVQELKNYITVNGGTPTNAATPIYVRYDQSASSPYGRRMLNPVTYNQILDKPTLQNIADTLGVSLNRVINQVEVTLPKYGQRIEIGRPGGALMSIYEPGTIAFNDQFSGAGTTLGPYVVLDVETDGPTQKVHLSDYPVTSADLQGLIEGNNNRAAATATTPATVGGGSYAFSPSGCGGLTLLARGSSNAGGSASGTFSAGQASFVLDSGGNCQVLTVITLSINFTNAGPDVIIQGFCDQSGTGTSSGLFSIPVRVPQDGHWHTVTLVIPATAPMADGTYSSYVTVTNGAGLYSSVYDVQAYLYSSGGSVTTAGIGVPPGSGNSQAGSDGSGAGSVQLATGGFDTVKQLVSSLQSPPPGGINNFVSGSAGQFPFLGPPTAPMTVHCSYSNVNIELLSPAANQSVNFYLTLRDAATQAIIQTSVVQAVTVGAGTQQNISFDLNLGPVVNQSNFYVGLEMTGDGTTGGNVHVSGTFTLTKFGS